MSIHKFKFVYFLLAYGFVYSPPAISELLPEPLTLEVALALIGQQHPNLRYANAEVKSAQSQLLGAQSSNDLSVSLSASVGWLEPSKFALNKENEDHRLGLIAKKTLYDFGRFSSKVDSATHQLESNEQYYINAQQQHYINVMKRYFDVVLADLQYYRYNEEMAVAYIQFDRMQNRQRLGQFTEIDVAEKEAEYQRVRRLRTHSQNQQRITRSLLAQALNKPNDLPATVSRPKLDVLKRNLPEIEKIHNEIKNNNPILRALRAELESAKQNLRYAQSSDSPMLTAGFEAYDYTRVTNSSDKWRANVQLDVPLWAGDKVDADVASAKAVTYKIEAKISQQEFMLYQKALELVMEIETLKTQQAETLAAMNFTELSLDQSRALYELEVQTDLGYSMVKFSEAEREVVKTDFSIALAWAELDALTGNLLTKKINNAVN